MIARFKNLARRQQQLVVAAVVVCLVAAAGLAFAVVRGDDDGLGENVALRVGGDEITISELNARNETLEALYGIQAPSDDDGLDEYRRNAAKSMAIFVVLQRAAEDEGIAVPDEQVDEELDAFVQQAFNGDENAYLDSLANVGTTEKAVRDEVRRQLELRELLEKVRTAVTVTDADLAAGFEKYEDMLRQPERREVNNIVVATRKEAQRVRARLQQGEDVAALARELSLDEATRAEGGRLGAVSKAEFEPAVGEAVFTTPVGRVYGPVQGAYGWNVGVVTKVREPVAADLKRDRKRLRAFLLAQETQTQWSEWLEKKMRAADIEYAEEYRPSDPYDVSTFSTEDPAGTDPEEGLE